MYEKLKILTAGCMLAVDTLTRKNIGLKILNTYIGKLVCKTFSVRCYSKRLLRMRPGDSLRSKTILVIC